MSELYPSLKPLKQEKPKRDVEKRWVLPGTVTQASYERKKFQEAFKRVK